MAGALWGLYSLWLKRWRYLFELALGPAHRVHISEHGYGHAHFTIKD